MKRHHWILVAVLGLFALPAALSGLAGWARPPQAAPVIRGTTLNGDVITATPDGGIIVLNFWATWCGPCRAEMPLLEAAHAPEDGVSVLAVNSMESAATVAAFLAAEGLSLPVLLDPAGELGRAYGVSGYPTTAFIAPDGTLYALHLGLLTNAELTGYIADGWAYAVGSGGSESDGA